MQPDSLGGSSGGTPQVVSYEPSVQGDTVCPNDQEIRNMEVLANSATLGASKKAFLADEVRRARQCRKGQGNYSAGDWQTSHEAQRAQNNLTGRPVRSCEQRAYTAQPTQSRAIVLPDNARKKNLIGAQMKPFAKTGGERDCHARYERRYKRPLDGRRSALLTRERLGAVGWNAWVRSSSA